MRVNMIVTLQCTKQPIITMIKTSYSILIPILTLCTLGASAQSATVYTTSGDRSIDLQQSTVNANSGASANFVVNTGTKYQEIDGFGYAITYAACYNLMQMSESMRNNLLAKTFSPSSGCGSSYVRISIGTNDFSSDEYTLCDTKGPDDNLLQYFGLHSDEINYVIPMLQKIKALNPNLKIIATPWTPPLWMKTNGAWTNGELSSTYYDAYGDYFVKFIQTMKGYGLDIYAVTPQNEPMNRGNSASCYMPWETEADFISQSLAPKFKAAGLTTKIYLWDHNYNYDDVSDQIDYPYNALQRMGTSFSGYDLVAGSAWHKYTGYDNDWTEMIDIYGKTGKDNLFTEASIGTWNNGDDLYNSLARDMRDLVIHPAMGYCRGSIAWNFALDIDGDPHRGSGACTTCRGAISVAEDGSYYVCNSHYYIMAQASAVVKPGAYRVATSGDMSNIYFTAYQNTDGTVGVLISNMNGSAQTVNVAYGDEVYSFSLPAMGVVTALLPKSSSDTSSTVTPTTAEYYFTGSLTDWNTPGEGQSIALTNNNGLYYSDIAYSYEGSTTDPERFKIFQGTGWDIPFGLSDTSGLGSESNRISGPVTGLTLSRGSQNDIYYSLNGTYRTVFNPSTYKLSILNPNPDDLYLSGTFNNWTGPGEDSSAKMTYNSMGYYTCTLDLSGSDRFCIYTGTGWDGLKYGRASADAVLSESNVTVTLQSGASSAYTTVFDPTNSTISILDPSPETLYVAGSFNNWTKPGEDSAYKMNYTDYGYYTVTLSLSGSGRFNIHTGTGWDGTKYGRVSNSESFNTSNNTVTIAAGTADSNVDYDIYYDDLDGTYTFAFNPTTMELKYALSTGEDYYLSGTFNNWVGPGEDSSARLVYCHDGNYLCVLSISGSSDDDRFGIYTGTGWDGQRYGRASTSAVISESNATIALKKLTSDEAADPGNDVHFNLNGTYALVFNPVTLELSLVGGSSSTSGGDEYYLSGLFNGWTGPGEDSSAKLSYTSDGNYQCTLSLSGSGDDARMVIFTGTGWDGQRYGRASTDAVLSESNTSISLKALSDDETSDPGNDIHYDLDGTYTLVFNPITLELSLGGSSSSSSGEYYLSGLFNGWTGPGEDTSAQLRYISGNSYQCTLSLSGSGDDARMVIYTGTGWDGQRYGRASTDAVLSESNTSISLKALSDDETSDPGNDIHYDLDGTYTLTFNLSNMTLSLSEGTTTTVSTSSTSLSDFYITGSLCGWDEPGTGESLQMSVSNSVITCDVPFDYTGSETDPDRFKLFQGTGWGGPYGLSDTSSLGGSQNNAVTGPATGLSVTAGSENDIYYTLSGVNSDIYYENLDGTYTLTFNPTTLELTITKGYVVDTATVFYISGEFNDWATPGSNTAYEFTNNGSGVYTCKVTLSGSDRFVIYAGAGWDGVKYGRASTDAVLTDSNTTVLLQSGIASDYYAANIHYENLSGTYTLTFLPSSLSLSIVKDIPSGVAEIDADGSSETVYFDLMGRKVVSPGRGVYIKVTGSRVEKIVLR